MQVSEVLVGELLQCGAVGRYANILRRSASALVEGGVHTPNQRWEICKAVAHLHHLWPRRTLRARINDWLGEGIDADAEASTASTAPTTRPRSPTAGCSRWPGWPASCATTCDANLERIPYRLETNSDDETMQSRRQDQTGTPPVWKYLMQFRRLAQLEGDTRFAAVAMQIIDRVEAEPTSIRKIASGLSANPTFFKLRKGDAILESVRLSPRFFSTGHFRSNGVVAVGDGWRLRDRVKVAYHQPLPQRFRRRDGNYPLGSEGRFYSKMDFPHRAKQYRVLETTITIRQLADSAFDLLFDVDGPATSLTIELCFRSGGSLSGVVPASGADNFQLVEGEGAYTVGEDTITFGPGTGSGVRQPVAMDPGEKYTYLGGNLVPVGQRVYLTGEVPFRYTLRIG